MSALAKGCWPQLKIQPGSWPCAPRGQVGLVGHSLGSVILFDILSTPVEEGGGLALDFVPCQYIALGSPLGCFLSVAGVSLRDRLESMKPCHFAQVTAPCGGLGERPGQLDAPLPEAGRRPPVLIHLPLRCAWHSQVFHPNDPGACVLAADPKTCGFLCLR